METKKEQFSLIKKIVTVQEYLEMFENNVLPIAVRIDESDINYFSNYSNDINEIMEPYDQVENSKSFDKEKAEKLENLKELSKVGILISKYAKETKSSLNDSEDRIVVIKDTPTWVELDEYISGEETREIKESLLNDSVPFLTLLGEDGLDEIYFIEKAIKDLEIEEKKKKERQLVNS